MDEKVIRFQSIDYRTATLDDIDFLYALHVATMKEYVDKTWGWDDAFQESLFRKNFAPDVLQIITLDNKDIGMLSLDEREKEVFYRSLKLILDISVKGLQQPS